MDLSPRNDVSYFDDKEILSTVLVCFDWLLMGVTLICVSLVIIVGRAWIRNQNLVSRLICFIHYLCLFNCILSNLKSTQFHVKSIDILFGLWLTCEIFMPSWSLYIQEAVNNALNVSFYMFVCQICIFPNPILPSAAWALGFFIMYPFNQGVRGKKTRAFLALLCLVLMKDYTSYLGLSINYISGIHVSVTVLFLFTTLAPPGRCNRQEFYMWAGVLLICSVLFPYIGSDVDKHFVQGSLARVFTLFCIEMADISVSYKLLVEPLSFVLLYPSSISIFILSNYSLLINRIPLRFDTRRTKAILSVLALMFLPVRYDDILKTFCFIFLASSINSDSRFHDFPVYRLPDFVSQTIEGKLESGHNNIITLLNKLSEVVIRYHQSDITNLWNFLHMKSSPGSLNAFQLHSTGSMSEDIPFIACSDVDYMLVSNYWPEVICDGSHVCQHDYGHVRAIQNKDNVAYMILQVVNKDNLDSVVRNNYLKENLIYGTIMDSHEFVTNGGNFAIGDREGPAIKIKPGDIPIPFKGGHVSLSMIGSFDQVLSLRCRFFPPSGSSFFTRPRQHGWPPQSLVDKIKQTGCHVVPVGHHNSVNKDIEWRWSFSVAEKVLITAFPEVMKHCMFMLKMIKKYYWNIESKPQPFSSYMIKTACLWISETEDLHQIQSASCLCMKTLEFLIDGYRKRKISSYFIVEQNLINHLSLEDSEEVVSWLGRIRDNLTSVVLYSLYPYIDPRLKLELGNIVTVYSDGGKCQDVDVIEKLCNTSEEDDGLLQEVCDLLETVIKHM